MENRMVYYDIDSYIMLENEKGDRIELCVPIAETDNLNNIDYDLGIVNQDIHYQAIELQGYAVQSKFSAIAMNSNEKSQVAEYKIYLNARTFHPDMWQENSMIGVNGRYYQLELTEPIYHRGIILYYVGTLIENDKTVSDLSITESIQIKRKTH